MLTISVELDCNAVEVSLRACCSRLYELFLGNNFECFKLRFGYVLVAFDSGCGRCDVVVQFHVLWLRVDRAAIASNMTFTPTAAVWPESSCGDTSTRSNPTVFFSIVASINVRSSSVESPSGSGFPTPGANAGSRTSISTVT